ncbi:hypothetical protein FRC02_005735 [Tulasnella sp. 418]|nr:hypothetical protein FRC02_005735 [Tulasnella sp. 418]
MFYLACLAEVSAVTMDGRNRQGQRGIQWDNLMAKIYGSWWYQNWYRILTIPPRAAMAREFHFPRIWYPWLKFTQPDAFLLDLQVLSTHPHAYISTMARATLSQLYPYDSPLANHSSWPVLHNKLPVNPDFFTFHKILVELRMVTMWVIDECRWKKRLEISRRRYLYRYCDNVLKLWMSSLASQEGGADDAQDGRIYQSALLLGYLILENHHNILRVTDSGESTPMKAARCLMSLKRWLDHSQGDDQKISAMDLELRNSLALSIVSSTAAYLQSAADTIKPGSRLTRLERFEDDENTIYVGMKHLEIPLLNLAAQEWQIPSLQDQAISALEAFYQIPGHADFRLFPWELPESSGLSDLLAKLKSRATYSSSTNKRVSALQAASKILNLVTDPLVARTFAFNGLPALAEITGTMAQDESVDIRIAALTVFLQTPVLYPSVSRPQGVNQRALARPTSFLQPAGQIHIDFHLPPDNNLLESYATALADHSSLLQAIQGAASPTSEEFIRKSISFIDMLQSSVPKPDLPSSLFEKGKYPAVLAMIASCDDEKQEQAYFDVRSSGEATEEMIRQVHASYEALHDFCLEELGSRLGPFFYDHIADRAHMIYPSWCLWIRNNIMSHVFRREDSPIDQ